MVVGLEVPKPNLKNITNDIKLILAPRSYKVLVNLNILMVHGMMNALESSLFNAIMLNMIALQLWVTSVVSHSTTFILDIKFFMNLAYPDISCKASINGILMDRLLYFIVKLLNLELSSLFLIFYGNLGGILIGGNGAIWCLLTFRSSPLTTLEGSSLTLFSSLTFDGLLISLLVLGASSFELSNSFLFTFNFPSLVLTLELSLKNQTLLLMIALMWALAFGLTATSLGRPSLGLTLICHYLVHLYIKLINGGRMGSHSLV